MWTRGPYIMLRHHAPRLAGFEAVRESWAQIFAGGAQLRVRTTEERRFDGQTLAVHNVIELVARTGVEAEPTQVMATNVFELTEGGWRMIVHHATPAPEAPRRAEPAPPAHTLH